MKKHISVVFVLMMSSLYALPARADSNGNQPEYPASAKLQPVAGSSETDRTGAPKLLVEFQSAHAEIPATYAPNIDAFGKYLKDNPASLAEIDGYADHTGHGPANGALATKRANAVKNYLVTHCAVASSRITAQGYGEVSTKNRNNTDADQQGNRSAIGTIVQPKS